MWLLENNTSNSVPTRDSENMKNTEQMWSKEDGAEGQPGDRPDQVTPVLFHYTDRSGPRAAIVNSSGREPSALTDKHLRQYAKRTLSEEILSHGCNARS